MYAVSSKTFLVLVSKSKIQKIFKIKKKYSKRSIALLQFRMLLVRLPQQGSEFSGKLILQHFIKKNRSQISLKDLYLLSKRQTAVWKCNPALWSKDHGGRIAAVLDSQWKPSVNCSVWLTPSSHPQKREILTETTRKQTRFLELNPVLPNLLISAGEGYNKCWTIFSWASNK